MAYLYLHFWPVLPAEHPHRLFQVEPTRLVNHKEEIQRNRRLLQDRLHAHLKPFLVVRHGLYAREGDQHVTESSRVVTRRGGDRPPQDPIRDVVVVENFGGQVEVVCESADAMPGAGGVTVMEHGPHDGGQVTNPEETEDDEDGSKEGPCNPGDLLILGLWLGPD